MEMKMNEITLKLLERDYENILKSNNIKNAKVASQIIIIIDNSVPDEKIIVR